MFSTLDHNQLDFYIEAGAIKIESKDSLHHTTARGGKLNEDFIKLGQVTGLLEADMRSFNKRMQARPADAS